MGRIAEELVAGLLEHGGAIEYKANVREILTEGSDSEHLATKGVRLADGRVFRCASLLPRSNLLIQSRNIQYMPQIYQYPTSLTALVLRRKVVLTLLT